MSAPHDYYYDVVGWPDVTIRAWMAFARMSLEQLDARNSSRLPMNEWRYVRLEIGDSRYDLDRKEHPYEMWLRPDLDEVRLRVPLWVAQEMRVKDEHLVEQAA